VLREQARQAPRAQQELLGLKEARAQLVLDQLGQLDCEEARAQLVYKVCKAPQELLAQMAQMAQLAALEPQEFLELMAALAQLALLDQMVQREALEPQD
jgi:hypothetical protein